MTRAARHEAGGLEKVRRSSDANASLNEITGLPVTTKDFRTLAATATAEVRFAGMAAVMRGVAELLGNTPAVTRKSYVHQRLVDAFTRGEFGRLHAHTRASSPRSRGEALVGVLFAEIEVVAADGTQLPERGNRSCRR